MMLVEIILAGPIMMPEMKPSSMKDCSAPIGKVGQAKNADFATVLLRLAEEGEGEASVVSPMQ
jgi:hypothetical protein